MTQDSPSKQYCYAGMADRNILQVLALSLINCNQEQAWLRHNYGDGRVGEVE